MVLPPFFDRFLPTLSARRCDPRGRLRVRAPRVGPRSPARQRLDPVGRRCRSRQGRCLRRPPRPAAHPEPRRTRAAGDPLRPCLRLPEVLAVARGPADGTPRAPVRNRRAHRRGPRVGRASPLGGDAPRDAPPRTPPLGFCLHRQVAPLRPPRGRSAEPPPPCRGSIGTRGRSPTCRSRSRRSRGRRATTCGRRIADGSRSVVDVLPRPPRPSTTRSRRSTA